ncbi:hypothetical protein BH09GEM1_BH09GEM1_13870 [soil metagenome]
MKPNAIILAVALLGIAGSLEAQSTSTPAPAPRPAPRPRVGYAGTPTPPPTPSPQVVIQPVYVYSPGGYVTYGAPYEALSDGSVLVNFGNGYERVLRQCATSAATTQVNQNGRDALGRIPDPPGIAAIKAGTRGQASGAQPPRNGSACYRADQRGQVEMVTEPARGVRP